MSTLFIRLVTGKIVLWVFLIVLLAIRMNLIGF